MYKLTNEQIVNSISHTLSLPSSLKYIEIIIKLPLSITIYFQENIQTCLVVVVVVVIVCV